jgi:hypothetical protein
MSVRIEETILLKVMQEVNCAVSIIDELHSLGYVNGFILSESQLHCVQTGKSYAQIDIMVDEFFVLEKKVLGDAVFTIYALRHRTEDLKGIFIAV